MSFSPSIATNLKAELKSTFDSIIANPNCGKTMQAVQVKYIAQAQKEFEVKHPKAVAKRLAKNTVTAFIQKAMSENF